MIGKLTTNHCIRTDCMHPTGSFLPMSREELLARGWDSCDFIIVTGDAYVDHPTFGAAVIGRSLEADGFRVGIIAQPAWNSCKDFTVLGKPRLAFLITSGNLDSMVAHYTAAGKPRSNDSYTPGGAAGKRPDRAVITYTSRARQAYHGIPIIIGGLEASLRRLAHYDYWTDRVRRSLLLDAKADLLVYGMAETAIRAIAAGLAAGIPINKLHAIPGTVFSLRGSPLQSSTLQSGAPTRSDPDYSGTNDPVSKFQTIELPDFQALAERDAISNTASAAARQAYALSCQLRLMHENPFQPQRLLERYEGTLVIQNPPPIPLQPAELDRVYTLPFTREEHPSYRNSGGVPALQEVKFSITSSRGCFGDCSFCAITSHQGRTVQARSHASILEEAQKLTRFADFKGYIHDIGGPTANFRAAACKKQARSGPCPDKLCLFPKPCRALEDSHKDYLGVLRDARRLPGIKKVFIRSGIRYDYLFAAADPQTIDTFITELARHHVSGQLKVAPEHVSPQVLEAMGKPGIEDFSRFAEMFREAGKKAGKKQYIIPYFISGHPGSTLADAVMLAEFLRDQGFVPDQVQDFYPTPGTVSTCMYFTGLDPRPGKNFAKVYVPKGREKNLQRALVHFHKPENRKLVIEALKLAGRPDLIGSGKNSLVPSRPSAGSAAGKQKYHKTRNSGVQ